MVTTESRADSSIARMRASLRRTASSDFRRATNWPIWLPRLASVSSRSSSGTRSSRVKNSIAPRTRCPLRTGKERPAWSPASAAARARGKFGSTRTSSIHAGSPVATTRPGRPSPSARTVSRDATSKLARSSGGAHQTATQRTTRSPSLSASHAAPNSQSRFDPIASRIASYAASVSPVSASTRATRCSASRSAPAADAPGWFIDPFSLTRRAEQWAIPDLLSSTCVDAASIEQLARLSVELGANVQPGQVVGVSAETGQEEIARAVAEAAYERGAKFVDVRYFDSEVKRLRLLHAPDDTLAYVPGWHGERVRELSRERGASVALVPPVTPGVLAGVDPARAGKDQLPSLKETLVMVNERTVNWTAIPAPNERWARVVYGDGEGALERLWSAVGDILRLDEPDPIASWQARMTALDDVAARLTESRLDAVHFEGPGTDLTIGLLPTSQWTSALFTTVDDIRH